MIQRECCYHDIRQFYLRNLVVGAVLICVAGACAGDEETPPADFLKSLLQDVRSQRGSIKSIHMTLHVDRRVMNEKFVASKVGYEGDFEVWLDKDRVRCDSIIDRNRDVRRTNCVNCFDENKIVDYINTPLDRGRMAVSIRDPKYATAANVVIDPRYIGLFPSFVETSTVQSIDSIFSAPDQGSVSIQDGEHDGRPCRIIEWNSFVPVTIRCWTSMESPQHIAKLQIPWTNGRQECIDELVVTYGHLPSVAIEYPRQVQFAQYYDGEPVLIEEVNATIHSVNEPIDSSVFTIGGLSGVTIGTPVQWVSDSPPPAEGPLSWDGDQVVATTISDELVQREKIGEGRIWPRWFIVGNVALLCGLACLICLRWLMRARS